MSNVIHVSFGDKTQVVCSDRLWQYDYGQILVFDDLELPTAYEVHFGNDPRSGQAVTAIGGADGVEIPNEVLETGSPVYAYIYLHTGASDGETEYRATIYVYARPEVDDTEPTPEQESAISQAIAALNNAIDVTDANVNLSRGFAESASQSEANAQESATIAQESAESAQDALAELDSISFDIDANGHIIYSKGSD